ncbi:MULTISPECIES: helix-turn-helix domain-containing protein [Pseudomonas]|uniref:Helix-turn-helix transcriptional regulator n=1 Tax=Pseudomonas edaphica TaxID=2006980 RepID=A0A7Y8E9A1_9PSED|nr:MULTISPECIES: helix-turn-helix transcriptional regulator [Pseudomonas]MCF5232206.1 helix-turn-helix domain-containing protein [Pseudomonas sp. PA-5-4H]MCF5235673.1 helix-turn-helix domain-containing protein [Pseudomonas sp. PA-5-4G]MCF5248884.1 helix-turn-helix domain-containing protein [Pseudomonas sp. PA-5-4B]MCF5252422.1 helix-turn-helix domain-containing protein [Pseudomonas sp. PA-5-4B]MCF5261761.1 helix-turn-helix domain-containing protein [Pseudomonas sp. PA-5-4A]
MHHIPKLSSPDDPLLMGETTLAEGLGLPLAFGHAYLTLLVCLSGSARLTLNFKEHAVRRGDVLVLAEDTIALFKRHSRQFNVFFCLIPKRFAAEVAYPLPNPLFVFLHDHPHCVLAPCHRPLIEGWVAQMRDIAGNCPTYRHIMLRNQLQTFFLKIAEQLPAQPAGGRAFSRKEMLSWRFWELIGKHCTRHREVKFYADALSITPFYLSQLTKAFFNDSPKGLIDRQVTLEIKALLSYSNLAIGRVADALNFADASYLCRYFKRQTGVSLSGYRRHQHAASGQG